MTQSRTEGFGLFDLPPEHRRRHFAQAVVGRVDVLDLIAQHLHSPRVGGFVQLLDNAQIDSVAFLERLVQLEQDRSERKRVLY